MNKTTTWLNKNILQDDFLNKINNINNDLTNIKLALDSQLTVLNKDSYHLITKLFNPKNRNERALCYLLYQNCLNAEQISQGAGFLCLSYGLNLYKQLIKKEEMVATNEIDLKNEYKKSLENIKKIIENYNFIPNKNETKKELKTLENIDETLFDAIWELINLNGLEGKIYVEESKHIQNYCIYQNNGYTFQINPYSMFLTNNIWDANDCKLLLFNGFIENVSELENILTKTFETKIPLVLIATGFSEEVVATLFANKHNFQSIAIKIPTDVDSINQINDIGIVCNTEAYSVLKGNMLTFVKYEDLPIVKKITCEPNKTTFKTDAPIETINGHMLYLLNKRKENFAHEDLVNIFDKRIKTMQNNITTLILPSNLANNNRVAVDNVLRKTKTILNYGLINLSKIKSSFKPNNTFDKMIFESLRSVDKTTVPTLSLLLALETTGNLMLQLISTNGIIVID